MFFFQSKNPATDFYKRRVKYFFDTNTETVMFNNLKEKRMNINGFEEMPSLEQDLCPPMSLFSQNYFEGKLSPRGKYSYLDIHNNGKLSTIPSLSWHKKLNTAYDPNLDAIAVEIPYDGKDLSLIIVSPGKMSKYTHESLGKIEAKINSKSWENLLKLFVSRKVDLQIPIFQTQSLLELNDTMIALGTEDMFSKNADFSGINGSKDLYLSSFIQSNKFLLNAKLKGRRNDFVHEAHVEKIERSRNKRSQEALYHELKFDTEFMYMVRHNPTGLLLFIGRYDPRSNFTNR